MIGIYKITSPNNRIYIGQSQDIEKRIEGYKKLQRCKNQTRLVRSFMKYGVDNHQFDIIEECSSESLNIRELYWGLFYNTLESGLNCFLGGSKIGKMSEETKLKIGKSNIGKIKHSESNRINISDRMKGNTNKLGYVTSNKTKEKMSVSHSGKIDSNETRTKKSESALGKIKSDIHKQRISNSHPTKKQVIQETLEGVKIELFISINEASRQTGVRVSDISACCNNKQKTAKGYRWKFLK